MQLTTDALDSRGYLDPRYTDDFDNSSPELRWEGVPPATQCLALICEDPDAPQGVFTHWVIYNIPAQIHHLPAGIPAQEALPNGIRQGNNSYGKLGYSGPNPPLGNPAHRYYFKLYALRERPEIPARATSEQIRKAMAPYILDSAELMGRYGRTIQKAG
jgi:Raf kinase inhibitor-like YbhB/YbcL family protein